ncbi:MAG: PadR family transcriptional regulator [Acidimicrobiales bacterium]
MNEPAFGRRGESAGRGGRGRGGGGRGGGRKRGGPHRRGGVGRGDVRIAVLALLTEEPMHGYQIMSELAERSQGAWQPSPGSIYPLLQQLADEGLVTSDESDGRKVFTLTEAGIALADESADQPPVWERFAQSGAGVDLREAIAGIAVAARQVATTGTSDQVARAAEILVDARKRLYQLLAE